MSCPPLLKSVCPYETESCCLKALVWFITSAAALPVRAFPIATVRYTVDRLIALESID